MPSRRFAAVYAEFLQQRPAVVAPLSAIGAWVFLHARAAEAEDPSPADEGADPRFGWGRIHDLSGLTSVELLRAVGIDAKAVRAAEAAGLCRWDGADLLVAGFDLEGHQKLEAARARARQNGKAPPAPGRKRGRTPKSPENTGPGKPTGFGSQTKSDEAEKPVPIRAVADRSEVDPSHTETTPEYYPPGFLEVWAAFPRKEAKQAAKEAWEEVQPSEHEVREIVGALRWQTVSRQWLEKGMIPHLATYLRGRRWEDEPSPTDRPAGVSDKEWRSQIAMAQWASRNRAGDSEWNDLFGADAPSADASEGGPDR